MALLATRRVVDALRVSHTSAALSVRGLHAARVSGEAAKEPAEPAAPKASTIKDAFNNSVARFARRNGFRSPGGEIRWTFAEYASHVNAFANMLVELNFKVGDSLAVCHNNGAEYVIAQLGSAKAGVTLVNVNPSVTKDELEAVLQAEKCRGVFFDNRNNSQYGMIAEIFPETSSAVDGAPLESKRHPYTEILIQSNFNKAAGVQRLRDILVYNPFPNPLPKINITGDTVAQTTYSDGKKVSSHKNSDILKAADSYASAINLNEQDVAALAVPNHSGRGYAASVAVAAAGGTTLILPDNLGGALRALSIEANTIIASSSAVSGLTSSEEFGRFQYKLGKALVVDANKADDAARNCSSKFGAKNAVALKA